MVPGEDHELVSGVADDDGTVLAEAADGLADLGEVAAPGIAGVGRQGADLDVPLAQPLNCHAASRVRVLL